MRIPCAWLAAAALLAACAAPPPPPLAPDGDLPDVLLIGEQHDAASHRRQQLYWVAGLADRRRLAALTIEMADRGKTTAGLPTHAAEADVRAALAWNEEAWPWETYGPVVMAAVRAGVPVLGANLPRAGQQPAMQDASLDTALPAAGLAAQQQAMRKGHCDLLPETQIAPMARVQIARDRAMAQTIAGAVRRGQTVLLVAGAGHVDPVLGVPRHLPERVTVQSIALRAEPSGKDHCEGLRRQLKPATAP